MSARFKPAPNFIVNVKLLDTRDGSQIWTAKFDHSKSDVFVLQTDIASQVAGLLLTNLTNSDEKLLGKRYTDNPEAYRSYLRGRVIYNRRIDNAFQQILDEYQKAVSLDPTFSLAYSGLADLFSRLGNGKNGQESIEAYNKARFYAQKALEMDNDSAEAYTSLGRIKRIADWDWKGAESDFQKAIELDPNNATAIAWYAQMLSFLGRHDEAKKQIDRAIEIDPVSPSVTGVLFPVIEGREEFDEGLRLAEQAYYFDKENQNSRRSFATFLYHKGEFLKVIELCQKFSEENEKNNHVWYSLLAASYFKTGQTEKSNEYRQKLEAESKTNTKYIYSLAVIFAETGRSAEAIAALEKCYELREEKIVWINTEPRLSSLKSNPAFRELVAKLNLG